MKWIGQHIVDFIARFRSDVYLEDVADGTVADNKFLGLDSNNKVVKEAASATVTDLHSAGVDGSANQLLTDDGDGTITSESTLTYDSETLTIGADDNGVAIIQRKPHSDGQGGQLRILGGNATAGQTDTAGNGLRLFGGAGTGTGAGGHVEINTFTPAASTGTTLNSSINTWDFGDDGLTTIPGNIAMAGNLITHADTSSGAHMKIQSGRALYLLADTDDGIQFGDTDSQSMQWSEQHSYLGLTSANASQPVLEITNTHDGTTSGELKFTKNSTGDDSDVMGLISFYGTDSSDNAHERLAYMDAIITDSAHGSEAASLRFYVAENDATLTQGLLIAGQADADGEVDVTIAAGAASTTKIAGTLTMGSTATIDNSGVWVGGVIPSAKLDADTAHLTTTQDFTGNKTFSGIAAINNRLYSYPGTTDGDHVSGDIMYYDSGTATTVAGFIYYFNGSGSWTIANNDAEVDATGMLAVALGENPDVDGMLLRGMVTLTDIHGTEDHGAKLHLHSVDGTATTTVTTTSGSFVRIIGYNLHNTNDAVYFNPDNTFVEVA
jgi:hypothetical protein